MAGNRKFKLMIQEMSEALAEGDINSLIKLIEQGEPINAVDGSTGETLIIWASSNSYTDFAIFLIKKGAKIEDRDYESSTPLMLAARRGNAELVRFLLESGANPNCRNHNGHDAMRQALIGKMYGSAGQHNQVIKILIQYGAKDLT